MGKRKVQSLGKAEARRIFFQIRKDRSRIELNVRHIFCDHPERQWTKVEILQLICDRQGSFEENNQPSAWEDSWLWKVVDDDDRKCTFPLRIEEDENGNIIFVITAIR
ncbi:MAG: hypothetical protein V4591_04625 [Bdellovibrionota bacterium]